LSEAGGQQLENEYDRSNWNKFVHRIVQLSMQPK
jgi:hypothetical protein